MMVKSLLTLFGLIALTSAKYETLWKGGEVCDPDTTILLE